MNTEDFTEISARYERDSLIQKSAAERLIGLLDIKRDDDLLDLGCGTGNLTRKIRAFTDGRVTGADPSPGMIREAEAGRAGINVIFEAKSAEQLDYDETFSVIFCNSAFQWFRDHERALLNCFRALKPGGRMGIQAPAKKEFCSNFLAAMDAVAKDPRTSAAFGDFRPPWLFLDAEEEYAALFRRTGFVVPFANIETVTTRHSPDEVMTIFESGAAAGYLNREYYPEPLEESYAKAFREIIRKEFRRQAGQDGNVVLTFNRIYLVAVKS